MFGFINNFKIIIIKQLYFLIYFILKKQTKTTTLLFVCFITTTQSQTITGVISDTLKKPLESANIIAISADKNAQLKFAIADNKGRFKLELEPNVAYEVTVSYLGYLEQMLQVAANSPSQTHNFLMVATGENLKVIKIKYDYKPIVVKKDTLIYDVKNFVSGNERKMKQVLEKLAGVEVDKKGGITVQGKKVTQMMVENKSFFGGGSKLAVENIPADAIEKIEVIDHFNKVGFLKKVSDSDEFAMNVVLKSSKKKFIFVDVEVGSGVGFSQNNLLHTGLFYYSPKSSISAIADANNIGKSTFSFEDLMRFDGGLSSFIAGRKSSFKLFEFTNDNTDVVQNKSQFAAINFSQDINSKLSVIGYGIFSKVLLQSQNENRNMFLNSNAPVFENRFQNAINRTQLGIGNMKMNYAPSKNSKLEYSAQYQSSNNRADTKINSITNTNASTFDVFKNADNQLLQHYVEWHKSYNDKHATTFVVNHTAETDLPINQWITNQYFLAGFLPLQNDVTYNINQIKKISNNIVEALFKHYWIVSNFHHIYSIVGYNFSRSTMVVTENQRLSNGQINDFTTAGFNNNINYSLNDVFAGMEYKCKIGKLTNKASVFVHQYIMKSEQEDQNYDLRKNLFQPEWLSDLDFNQSESLNFRYKLSNEFPTVNLAADRFTLQNFNTVFKGNSLLQNQQFHTASMRYSKFNSYRSTTVFGDVSYTKKTRTLRNEIEFTGINQFLKSVLTNNPETNWRTSTSFSKKKYRLELKFRAELNGSEFIQKVNNQENTNNTFGQNYEVSLGTAYKKWPDVHIGFKKGFNEIMGIASSKFKNQGIDAGFEYTFFKSWTFNFDYENQLNRNDSNQSNFFEVATSSLRYQKKDSPFGFELSATNLFNTKSKNNNSISDFMTSEQTIFILPRILCLSATYKL